MPDLEAIAEALVELDGSHLRVQDSHNPSNDQHLDELVWQTIDASRALVRILRDGKEPDYEASAVVMYPNEIRPNVGQVEMARRVVDAAIKGRILVNPEE